MKLGIEFGYGVQDGRTMMRNGGTTSRSFDFAFSQWAAQNMGGVGSAALQTFAELEALCQEAAAFMRNKLSLPGPPVSRGGVGGQPTGDVTSARPILHRDSGELQAAVTIRVEGAADVRRRLRALQNWQGRSGGHIRSVITIGIDMGSPAAAYAYAQEFGYRPNKLPSRPYMRPTQGFIDRGMKRLESQLSNRTFYQTFSGSIPDLPRGFVVTRGA